MSDPTYQTKNYEAQGGSDWEIGGTLNIQAASGGQLQIDSTQVTPSAAELNVLHGVTAGTAKASGAAVLGVNKNLDTLALPVGGLAIGAGAGTSVTPTAAELNQLHETGTIGADAIGRWHEVKDTYDFAVNGGAVGSIPLNVQIPAKAVIIDGMIDVVTSLAGNTGATLALQLESAGDILAATGYGSLAAGRHDVVPDGTAAHTTKTTVARTLNAVIATATLTAGKLHVWLRYLISE